MSDDAVMHTPGPWTVDKQPDGSHMLLGRFICFAKIGALVGSPESELNARLIAAAPELLAACRALTFNNGYTALCDSEEGRAAFFAAKTAISKAEGRS